MTRDAKQLLQLLLNKYNQTKERKVELKCEEIPEMIVCNELGITKELANEGCIVKETISVNMEGDIEVDLTSTGLYYFEDEKNNKLIPQSVTKIYNNSNVQDISGINNTVVMNISNNNLDEIKSIVDSVMKNNQNNQEIVDFMEEIKETIDDNKITENRAQRWIRRIEQLSTIGANFATCTPQLIALGNLLKNIKF